MACEIDYNAYGVAVVVGRCGSCGARFTVCPPVDFSTWGEHCLAETCPSYDPARDADRLFDESPELIRREPGVHKQVRDLLGEIE